MQPDGKIILGGRFSTIDGTARNSIARLNADGSLDESFDPNGPGAGKPPWCAGRGAAGRQNPARRAIFLRRRRGPSRLVRLNANGSLDKGFDPGTGFAGPVRILAIQPDGKALFGGDFTTFNGVARNRLARLYADGSLDGDFDPLGANGTVTSLAVQEDGGILLGGYFSSVAGVPAPLVARLKADGTANTAFHPTVRPSLNVRTLAQQPDDQKLLVAGDFATVGTTAGSSITRLNPDGSLDPSFRPDATLAAGSSPAAVVRPDREILAIFNLTIFNLTITDSSTTGKTPSRNTSGLSAPAAGEGRTRAVSAPIKNPLPPAAGDSFIPEVLVALLHADGSIDTGFRQPAVPYNGQGSALVLQTDGKFLVGGAFGVTKQVSNSLGANLVRFNADGSLDSGFVPGFGANSSEVDAIGVQPADGKIVVGVAYAGVANASVVSQIVRLLPDGSLDASFTAGIAERGTINTVVIQPDGKILLGGGFPISSRAPGPPSRA